MTSEGAPGEEERLEGEVAATEGAMERVTLEDADFDLEVLTKHFTNATTNTGVDLSSYIAGYREVYKFLNLLGTVFGWVGSDVWAKIVQLEKYQAGEEKHHYANVKDMIDYEVEHDLIKTKKKDDPSGSRTLLRLHRALEYIIAFLHKLDDMQGPDLCSVQSVEAYEATLMKYHPWVVQKAAKLAMRLLPTKDGLILKVHPEGSESGLKKTLEDFPKAVNAMRKAYDALHVFYEEKDLLNIP